MLFLNNKLLIASIAICERRLNFKPKVKTDIAPLIILINKMIGNSMKTKNILLKQTLIIALIVFFVTSAIGAPKK